MPDPSRRLFFRLFAANAAVGIGEATGKVYVRIRDLPKLSEDELRATVPVIRKDIAILFDGRSVSARIPGDARPVLLFRARKENLFVFNRMNGRTALGQISEELAAATGWPKSRCFSRVRSMFFHLAKLRVSIHGNTVPVVLNAAPATCS